VAIQCPGCAATERSQRPRQALDRFTGIACRTTVKRHPVLRTGGVDVASDRGSSLLETGGLFEIAKPIASSLDVEDMAVMQQSIEDRGGEHFIAGNGRVARLM